MKHTEMRTRYSWVGIGVLEVCFGILLMFVAVQSGEYDCFGGGVLVGGLGFLSIVGAKHEVIVEDNISNNFSEISKLSVNKINEIKSTPTEPQEYKYIQVKSHVRRTKK